MKLSLTDLNYQGRVTFTGAAAGAYTVPEQRDGATVYPARDLAAVVTVTMERHEWLAVGRPVDLQVRVP